MISEIGKEIGNNSGFTLIEVVLAVGILAFGAIGILGAYAMSIDTLESCRRSIDAVHLLKEKMADIEEAAIREDGVLPGTDDGRFSGIYKDFEWRSEKKSAGLYLIVRKEEAEELKEYLNEVKVTVFNEKVKPARRFSLTTYMKNPSE